MEMIRMIIICASWLCAAAAGADQHTRVEGTRADTRADTAPPRRSHTSRTHHAQITHTSRTDHAHEHLHTSGSAAAHSGRGL